MRINDGHVITIRINDEDVIPSIVCPHIGKEATEAMKCTTADNGTEVTDCSVQDAIDTLGWEAVNTGGDDISVTVYPIPVEYFFGEEFGDTPVIAPVGEPNEG